ncbi:MAG: hypothetical protein O3B24_08145 [Verrucomicrobia bacterium]|nr:hypothetical protein [Verrucomicrobiota bacterium]
MKHDVRRARIAPDGDVAHTQAALAFEVMNGHNPQSLCQHVGLNWMTALDLHRRALLSFDPRNVTVLTRSQEAELRFLGRLSAAGCCPSVLTTLLNGLEKPYAYNIERMYFDWTSRQWRLIEDTDHIEEHLEEWLHELIEWGDVSVLERVRTLVNEAMMESLVRQRAADPRQRIISAMGGGA